MKESIEHEIRDSPKGLCRHHIMDMVSSLREEGVDDRITMMAVLKDYVSELVYNNDNIMKLRKGQTMREVMSAIFENIKMLRKEPSANDNPSKAGGLRLPL